MGNFEYFKSIINTWDGKEKHTQAMVKDMRKIINQFSSSVDSLNESEMEILSKEFKRIYKEVYK